MNVNALPTEVLAEIVGYLQHKSDRCNARNVCCKWNSVIETTVGMQKWIGNGSEFWDNKKTTRWRPLIEITKRGISDCFFSDVTDELSSSEIKFKLPNLVTKIEFDGVISQEIYNNILTPLTHLTTLVFHISTMSYVDLNLMKMNFHKTLTKLYIAADGFTKYHYPHFNMKLVYLNFSSICKTYFPRLKRFDSAMPLLLDKELELCQLLAVFADKHHKTLEELELKWTQRWRVDAENSNPRTEQDLADMMIKVEQVDLALKSMGLQDPSKWHLKSVSFITEDLLTICPTSTAMKDAMFSQTNLKRLHYMCWDYITLPVNTLQENSATLTEISLTVDDITEPVNCSAFLTCINLQRLTLQADGQALFNDLVNDVHRLQNIHDLPNSIISIKIRNIYITSQSVEWIAKELKNLQILILVNIGKMDNLGISMPTLLWSLKESPKLRTLKVKGLNSLCFMSTFGFENWPVDPVCPTCQVTHYKGTIQSEESSFIQQMGENDIVCREDRRFIKSFMTETDHGTTFVPLLRKSKGSWHVSEY